MVVFIETIIILLYRIFTAYVYRFENQKIELNFERVDILEDIFWPKSNSTGWEPLKCSFDYTPLRSSFSTFTSLFIKILRVLNDN